MLSLAAALIVPDLSPLGFAAGGSGWDAPAYAKAGGNGNGNGGNGNGGNGERRQRE